MVRSAGRSRASCPVANEAPYLVNLAGDWEKRPGAGLPHLGYKVFYQNLVLAGSYLRTHTRLATMEAANESGRHAVNAVLRHLRKEAKKEAEEKEKISGKKEPEERLPMGCPIWDPEKEEVDDLDLAKRVDRDLFLAGLPHAFDILGVESLVDFEEPRGAPGERKGGVATLGEELLSRIAGQVGGAVSAAAFGDLRRLLGIFTGER